MVTITQAREKAQRKYAQNFARWVTHPTPDVVLEVPLHPPTQTQALKDQASSIAWVRSWRELGAKTIQWETKQWASLGTQELPRRLIFHAPDEVASFCGASKQWRTIQSRVTQLLACQGQDPIITINLPNALRRNARRILALTDPDFSRLLAVLDWLSQHPASGLYIRQLPVPGVDTKWVEGHRRLVTELNTAITGQPTLGIIKPPGLVRARFLDPALAPSGVKDLAAPVAELAALKITPQIVFVFENLESVVAMPPIPGAVVVHGSGYAVDQIAHIPWLIRSTIIYWGDLDSHGMAILNRLRSYSQQVHPVLMDSETLETYRELWVTEDTPHSGTLSHLLSDELAVLARIRELENVRLEQERLPWPHCLEVLKRSATMLRGSPKSESLRP